MVAYLTGIHLTGTDNRQKNTDARSGDPQCVTSRKATNLQRMLIPIVGLALLGIDLSAPAIRCQAQEETRSGGKAESRSVESMALPYRAENYLETPFDRGGRVIHESQLLALKSPLHHSVDLFFDADVTQEVFEGKVPQELRELGPLVAQFDVEFRMVYTRFDPETLEPLPPIAEEIQSLAQLERITAAHIESVVRQFLSQERALRISQIGWWKTAWKETLYQVLIRGPVAKFLEIDGETREALTEIAKRECEILRTDAFELEWLVTQRCLSVLAPERRRQVEVRLGDLETAQVVPACGPARLLEHLSYNEELDRANRAYGNLPSKEVDRRLFLPGAELGAVITEFSLLRESRIRGWLGLDIEQESIILEQLEQQRALGGTLMREGSAARRRGDSRGDRDELRIRLEAERADCESRALETLSHEQRSRLQSLRVTLELRQRGIHRMLVGGSLGQEIGITDEEKRKLFAMADETKSLVLARWHQAIDSHHERLVSALDETAQERFQNTFGSPPKTATRPSPGDLAQRLEWLIEQLADP